MALPVISGDLKDAAELPTKTRTSKPAVSPYLPLVERALDRGKVQELPGAWSDQDGAAGPDGKRTNSEFIEITRELARAARQITGKVIRIKARRVKIEDGANAGKVTIFFAAYEDKGIGAEVDALADGAKDVVANAAPKVAAGRK